MAEQNLTAYKTNSKIDVYETQQSKPPLYNSIIRKNCLVITALHVGGWNVGQDTGQFV